MSKTTDVTIILKLITRYIFGEIILLIKIKFWASKKIVLT
jgi:hypothetical protein